jgi:hypothetical protein
MTDLELRPHDRPPAPDSIESDSTAQTPSWSRRRVLALVCAGGALSAAGPVGLIATRDGAKPLPRPIVRGRGSWTSFGSVAVLAAARDVRHDAAAHLHHDPAAAGGPLANRTWSTTVRVEIELHNGSDRPVLLSPGQFRLSLGTTGTTVSPYDAGRPVAAVPAGRTVRTWVTYLAPVEETDLTLRYDDPGLARPLAFHLPATPLPATTTAGGGVR